MLQELNDALEESNTEEAENNIWYFVSKEHIEQDIVTISDGEDF